VKAGIWNGETLRLWSLDTQDTAPQDVLCQAGLDAALEAHAPMILAGSPAAASASLQTSARRIARQPRTYPAAVTG